MKKENPCRVTAVRTVCTLETDTKKQNGAFLIVVGGCSEGGGVDARM